MTSHIGVYDTSLVTVSEAARELGTTRQNLSRALAVESKDPPRPIITGRTVRLYSLGELQAWWATR